MKSWNCCHSSAAVSLLCNTLALGLVVRMVEVVVAMEEEEEEQEEEPSWRALASPPRGSNMPSGFGSRSGCLARHFGHSSLRWESSHRKAQAMHSRLSALRAPG